MHLNIVIVDYLDPQGVLTTYEVLPKEESREMIADRLRDIHPERFGADDVDIGATRIYNSSKCLIERLSARIRDFQRDPSGSSFSFQFEHMGVPLGSSDIGEGGIYNFVLAPAWRLRKLWISDPYDSRHHSVETKKQFMHEVIWDTQCNTQFVEMHLRSRRGSFSFIVAGTASLIYPDHDASQYLKSRESESGVSRISENYLLDDAGKERLANEIADKADWLELKPNFFGIGININEIIKDSIGFFKKKLKGG